MGAMDHVTRLDVPGTYNFREVAPGTLAPHVLFRSDALHGLDRAGRQRVRDLGIGTVIDLRSAFDRRIGGRDRLRGTGAVRISIPIGGGVPHRSDIETATLAGVYRSLLAAHRADFAQAVREIAASDAPVLIHCTAGKDRTGLVVALLLDALGVGRDAIAADYSATADNLAGEWTERMVRKIRRFRVPVTAGLREILAESPASVLAETFDWIDESYGGSIAYLEGGGADAAVLRGLQRLLPR